MRQHEILNSVLILASSIFEGVKMLKFPNASTFPLYGNLMGVTA